MQILGNAQTNIETHQIRQTERAHWVVIAQFHRCVDVARTGNALLNHPHRLKSQGHSQPARRKARNVTHDDWFLPCPRDDFAQGLGDAGAGLAANYNLDQAHDMNRVEEVHSYDHLGMRRRSGDFAN